MTNPDSFFGGAPGLSWAKANNGVYSDTRLRGVARGGVIVKDPEIQDMTEMGTGKPIQWPDGRPKQQMVVTLVCDGSTGGMDEREPTNPADRGERRLYVRGYMVSAIKDALAKVGAPGLRQGGTLLVAWIDEKPSKTASFDPARVWAAQYSPPAVGLPDAGVPPQNGLSGAPAGNPFGGTPAQQEQAAPAASATPPGNPFGGGAVTGPPAQQPATPSSNPFG